MFCHMGFLQMENKCSKTWFLHKFSDAVQLSPKVVFTDASASIVSAIKEVVPNSLIMLDMLDEWHLSQRQPINVAVFLRGKKQKYLF